MDNFSSNLLDIRYFNADVMAYLRAATHGLERVVNNKGIITGSDARFPLADIDSMAGEISKGSPIVPEDVLVDSKVVTIKNYELSVKLFPSDLNATNSAGDIRSMAAQKVVNGIRNRYTQLVLDALSNYDDTDHEVGSASTDFTVDSFAEINLKTDNLGWGNQGKYILLPAEARYTLEQDEKFVTATMLTNGGAFAQGDASIKGTDSEIDLKWIDYRGWKIAFMPKKSKWAVGLPIDADDGALMGYAFKGSRIGFVANRGIETRVFEDKTKEDNPLIFKVNGAAGAGILDIDGVVGVKIKPNPLV